MGNNNNNKGNMGNWGNKGNSGGRGDRGYKAGYEYLLAYKITVPIYDYTIIFIKRWVDPKTRRFAQMEGAARSGHTNLPEGYMQQGRKGYIKLTGVNVASLGELLKDYQAIARQENISLWPANESKEKIREIGEIWRVIRENPALPDNPIFPLLPRQKEIAINLMITLVNQAIYLQSRLIDSIKQKHEREGGLTEELYRKRIEYRKKQNYEKTY